jgi:hypothetical protein
MLLEGGISMGFSIMGGNLPLSASVTVSQGHYVLLVSPAAEGKQQCNKTS